MKAFVGPSFAASWVIQIKRDEIYSRLAIFCFEISSWANLFSLPFCKLLHYFGFGDDYILQWYVLVSRFITRLDFADSIQYFRA